jgi:hypothetical protein
MRIIRVVLALGAVGVLASGCGGGVGEPPTPPGNSDAGPATEVELAPGVPNDFYAVNVPLPDGGTVTCVVFDGGQGKAGLECNWGAVQP